jgi:23S rRNA (cytosine1962-C5)-methyltransferase
LPEIPNNKPAKQVCDYQLVDSGNGRKLEQFGRYLIARPAAQAAWRPTMPKRWRQADATFDREEGQRWENRQSLPKDWLINVDGIRFELSTTDFGHVGIFPEQRDQWNWLRQTLEPHRRTEPLQILNLFAYSGGSTLACAHAGAGVCHVDASKGMVDWARRNATANGLHDAFIRWIVDDVRKFLIREHRRGRQYDGIILDPPSFGRGKRGEVFKIDDALHELLDLCVAVLSPEPTLFLLSCHTPGYTAVVLENILRQRAANWGNGTIESGEMLLQGTNALSLPSGAYARFAASR